MKLERQFSQELAPELRQETANKFREVRNRPDNYKDLKDTSPDGLPVEYDSWPDVAENFVALKKDIFGKIFKTEKYRERVGILESSLKWKKESDINTIKREYEKKFDEIMKNCPLSQEERDKYLSTEAMESMSLDNYLILLERLSGEAFYHVTRYGVRENTFISTGGGHTAGEGEFVDSFTPLLKDGHINSATSTILKNNEISINEDVIGSWIKDGKTIDEIVDKVMEEYGSDYFLDSESAHFSYGREFHHMYGAENNYKFYFYYPVEYILHNDFFQKSREAIAIGQGYINNSNGIDQQYNDFEIFNFGAGVPIDAGILCISDDVAVDLETGSQYSLKDGQPEIDESGEFKKPAKIISSREYWEKYFSEHPELKPNKIIYGYFGTSTYNVDENLEKLANEKNIYKQDESKTKEFKDYEQMTLKEIESIVRKKVESVEKSLG